LRLYPAQRLEGAGGAHRFRPGSGGGAHCWCGDGAGRGADEIDRLVRALDAVADQLGGHLADGERLSRHAREHERFAARSLEFIYRACACLAENSASTPWLTALLEDMAGCLQARCCSLALLDPVAEGLGVPAQLGAPRLARLLDEFDAEAWPGAAACAARCPARRGDGRAGRAGARRRQHLRGADRRGAGEFLFESRHSRLVDALAGLFALSLGNLQRNQRRRRLALMDERNAIAGELHDSLAQALSYMKLQIARLQLEIGRSCAACPRWAGAGGVGEIKTGLDSAYRHLRELLSAFRTSMPPGGLQQALREVVEELSARAGTEIGLDYRLGDAALSVNEEFHLLQIVREALTNVIRHARADHALISLDCAEGARCGCGWRTTAAASSPTAGRGHHGVSIMRERARQLGGSLSLQAGVDGLGTCVEMRFRPAPRGLEPDDSNKETSLMEHAMTGSPPIRLVVVDDHALSARASASCFHVRRHPGGGRGCVRCRGHRGGAHPPPGRGPGGPAHEGPRRHLGGAPCRRRARRPGW
jgi:two-component system nitrate/nitrite sensor histidine kinase NarX